MDISGNIMEPSLIRNVTNISQLETIINDYNENFRYYNRNLRDIVDLYRETINDERTRRLERQQRFHTNPPIRNTNNMYNLRNEYINQPIRNWNNMYNLRNDYINNPLSNIIYNNLQDVVVRPTNEEITLATETVIYDISMVDNRCPISLEPFEPDDLICRIKHCGHLFKRQHLINWFGRNVRCPVCRFDIRTYREDTEGEGEGENIEQIPVSENTSNNLITTLVRNLITNEMNRPSNINNTLNDFFVSFSIPLEIDISYNNTY